MAGSAALSFTGTPILTIAEVQKLTAASMSSVNGAMQRLQEAAIIAPTVVGRNRRQVFQAPDVVEAFVFTREATSVTRRRNVILALRVRRGTGVLEDLSNTKA